MMRKARFVSGMMLIASCAPDDHAMSSEPAATSIETASRGDDRDDRDHGEGRHRHEMSSTPIWMVEGPADPAVCFGTAVAVGDLDGDGHRDVIVGEVPCFADVGPQGRIAIYRGGRRLPSTTPVWTELDWQNPDAPVFDLHLAVGDVDGDGHDDLLVSSRAGAMVFTGISDLGAPLGAPSFRVPGTGVTSAVLADVDGDHRVDLVSVRLRAATVWRSTPGGPGESFTAVRTVSPVTKALAVGDANSDGIDDLVLTNRLDSQLLLGCRSGEPDCDGGLRTAPAWTTTAHPVAALIPDLNHDGLSEALVTDAGFFGSVGSGRVWLYLSDPATGGLSATPAWATLGDPHYPGFGPFAVVPGDLDGDHRASEFVISGAGRAYAFFPRLHDLANLQPGFAWPRLDATQAQIDAGEPVFGDGVVLAAAGDVDGDHVDDLAIGNPPGLDDVRGGRVFLFGGGRRDRHDPAPFLPGAPVCQLSTATGMPDITVDVPALERSMFVDRRTFAADACEITEGCIGGPGTRRLLRFATSIANFGGAPAIVPSPDDAPDLYHISTCDGEPELSEFSAYELTDASGATIAAGRKQSVFLVDIAPNCIDAAPAQLYLPAQGLSPGWGDVYISSTPCNWLDVTDVADGRYTLRVAVDTHHIIDQDNALPDNAEIHLELTGNSVTILH
jgi:Lysyl oxidase/FG-GAP-like repeat/FG-GAP repeat